MRIIQIDRRGQGDGSLEIGKGFKGKSTRSGAEGNGEGSRINMCHVQEPNHPVN